MITKVYNSAGGDAVDYSDLGTFAAYLQDLTTDDLDDDLTVALTVESGVHDAETMNFNGYTTSGLNLIVSGEVPLDGSGPGNGAIFRKSHTGAIFRIVDGYSLSSLKVENIEFDLVSGARSYGSQILSDLGYNQQVNKFLTFKNCRILNLSGTGGGTYGFRATARKYTGFDYTYTFNLENVIVHDFDNTTVTPALLIVNGHEGTVDCNYRGLVIGSSVDFPNQATWGLTDPVFNKTYEGCIFMGQASQYGGGPGTLGFSATDCISDNTCWSNSNITKTNVSGDITVNLSGEPAEGEVSFRSGQTGDFRLYDHSNNLAIGFATNSTLPSPDFEGNDRGISPFDLGAIELSIQSGGGEDFPPESAGGVALPLTFAYRININD
jgi:hypothetical protein